MKKFNYPIRDKSSGVFFILISVSLIFLLRNNHQPGKLLFNLMFSGISIFGLYELIRSFTSYTVTETSINEKKLFMSEKEIRFSDVSFIANKNESSKIILLNTLFKESNRKIPEP